MMNIKFDIFNSSNDVDEIIQFDNIRDLNDGFKKLFNHVIDNDNIDGYCDTISIHTGNVPDISEDNLDEYDFINHEDFNFVMDGKEYFFLINEYEIF